MGFMQRSIRGTRMDDILMERFPAVSAGARPRVGHPRAIRCSTASPALRFPYLLRT